MKVQQTVAAGQRDDTIVSTIAIYVVHVIVGLCKVVVVVLYTVVGPLEVAAGHVLELIIDVVEGLLSGRWCGEVRASELAVEETAEALLNRLVFDLIGLTQLLDPQA
jgi:hypothetical protein